MYKDLLLQFFLSMLPVLAFLLWHDKERGWSGFWSFITITSGISIIFCLLTTVSFNNQQLDFRIVPYLIGSLYGGYRALGILTIIYICLCYPMLESASHVIGFTISMLLLTALLYILIPTFQRASSARREQLGFLFISLFLLVQLAVVCIMLYQGELEPSFTTMLTIIMSAIGVFIAVWLSIYVVESIREKLQLQHRVNQLSLSYRNEVDKLQQFINKAPLAVMMVDRKGLITHVNDETLKLLSLQQRFTTLDNLKLNHYWSVFQSGFNNICVSLLDQAIQGRSSTTMPQMEGGKMLLYTSLTLHEADNQQVTGAALIAQDVTELSQLRDEVGRMERLSLVGQMAASITHEIRNPMAVIRGFVQLIQERSPEQHHSYFHIIIEELDRANLIISDFLSLAQNRELKMEFASLNSSISDLAPLLEADANLRGQTLEVKLADNLPLMKLNDREMKQMLLNFARNGMEAMKEKGILRIETSWTEVEIILRITDEGIGIPQEKMNHMFEPFFTTKTQGTGLGLPLCLSIVERHRGRIDVQSHEGKGTTFIVTFNISEDHKVNNNSRLSS